MTRARARALETEVTSLLSDISYDPLETWLLPKSEMLCVIRYQEDPPEDAHEDGQDPKSTKEENQGKKVKIASRHRTPAMAPDIQPLEIYMARSLQQKLQGPDIRRPARTSGPPHRKSGSPPEHPDTPSSEHRGLP